MREIKLRIWHKPTKRMYYVDHGDQYKRGKDLEWAPWVFVLPASEIPHVECGDFEKMLYSGLYDRNKKEIWESDVIRVEPFEGSNITPTIREVIFNRGEFCTEVNLEGTRKSGKMSLFYYCDLCEVIGNIYEHGHLLGDHENPEMPKEANNG